MGFFATVALTFALWAGANAPAYLVPTEVYINTQSSEEDKPAMVAFARAVLKVVESSQILKVVETDMLAPPGTFEIHLDLLAGDAKLITSWEVWVMDDRMRRQQVWRSGVSFVNVTADSLVWRGNALVTKQTIRVVQAIEQVELNLREAMKEYHEYQSQHL